MNVKLNLHELQPASSLKSPRPAQFVHRLPSSSSLLLVLPSSTLPPGLALLGYLATYTPLRPLCKEPPSHRGRGEDRTLGSLV